jgi:hypothetical protein
VRREETEGLRSFDDVIRVVEKDRILFMGSSDVGMEVVLVYVIRRERERRVYNWNDLGRLCSEIINAAGSEEFGY